MSTGAPPRSLQGTTAVVTGGTTGLGLGIAERFLAAGATVVCASRDTHDVRTVLDRFPERAHYHRADVSDEASVRDLMRFAHERTGRLDVVVANAGISRDAKLARLSLADWNAMVGTNLTGVFLTIRESLPYLLESGRGRIITVSSLMGSRTAVGAAGYCATKAGVEMLTRAAAIELGPKGISVNAIAPGFINTGMGKKGEADERLWQRYRDRIALGRLGDTAEVTEAAAFLAAPESSYVNGHVLEINGGLRWS
ncbi:SDR family NAD(P)-dependent oxidoreductase [Saccharopolyspora hirsuta]|uniref:SDR family NAD(P)-dependent oxidoreductase n=1 Tax=Saccharopolyspora hirsuta TaxID=1837 RepID=UPI00332AB2CC